MLRCEGDEGRWGWGVKERVEGCGKVYWGVGGGVV